MYSGPLTSTNFQQSKIFHTFDSVPRTSNIIPKPHENQYSKKTSETYFYEIFNKQEKKCPLKIPDTIFVSGNAIISWYFSSIQNGAILRKKNNKLNQTDVFTSLYEKSPLVALDQLQPQNQPIIIQPQSSITIQEPESQIEIPKRNTLMSLENIRQNNMSSLSVDNRSESIPVTRTKTIMRRNTNLFEGGLEPVAQVNQQSHQRNASSIISDIQKRPPGGFKDYLHLDFDLPYLAYVRFHQSESRPVKPYELYNILNERLQEVRVIQTYIYSRGSQDFKQEELQKLDFQSQLQCTKQMSNTYAMHMHNEMIQQSKNMIKGGCYVCQYTHYQQQYKTKFLIFKNKMSRRLTKQINSKLIRSMNYIINQKIQDVSKTIISFMESTIGIDIKRIQIKFIEDLQGEIVFLGIKDELVYTMKGPALEISSVKSNQKNNDDFEGFNSTKIIKDHKQWKSSKIERICYGKFCQFNIDQSEKYQGALKSRKHASQNLNLIPSRNKILQISSNLHSQRHHHRRNYSQNSLKNNNGNESQQNISLSKPPIYKNRNIYSDHYNALYKAVTVCQKCYIIYTILSEYLDTEDTNKIFEACKKIEQDRKNSILMLKKAEAKSLMMTEKYTTYNMDQKDDDVDLIKIGKNLTLKLSTGMTQVVKKGTKILSRLNTNARNRFGTMIMQNPSNSSSTPQDIRYQPNKTEKSVSLLKSSSLLRIDTMSEEDMEQGPDVTRPTEISKMREIPKVSYKLFQKNIMKKNLISLKTKSAFNFSSSPTKELPNAKIQKFDPNLQQNKKENNSNGEDSFKRQNNLKLRKVGFSNSVNNKLISMKQTMGISLKLNKGQIQEDDDDSLLPSAQRKAEHLVNYFYEISKDIRRNNSKSTMKRSITSQYVSPSRERKLNSFQQSRQTSYDVSLEDVNRGQIPEYQIKVNNKIQEIKKRDNSPGQSAFQNKIQEAILRLAQKYIRKFNDQKNARSEEKSIIENDTKSYRFSTESTPMKKKQTQPVNKMEEENQAQYNISSSFFHFTKLKHLQSIPYYRISTPKVPIYSFEKVDKDGHDDKYIIPLENYKMLKIEQYVEFMKIPLDSVKYSSVFLIDENTSLLYQIITNTDILQSNEPIKNYIVLLDIFGNFFQKRDFFQDLVDTIQTPVRFILINFPGSLYTQYNSIKHTLNNKFYCKCLDLLFFHMHEKNLVNFVKESFSFIGFGNGANIALTYTIFMRGYQNLESILVFNGFIQKEQTLQFQFETLIKTFKQQNGKYNIYSDFFYYNLIYSAERLKQNQDDIIYNNGNLNHLNQSHNYISKDKNQKNFYDKLKLYNNQTKIDIIKGFLSNISLEGKFNAIQVPIISFYSEKNSLINLKQQEALLDYKYDSQLGSDLEYLMSSKESQNQHRKQFLKYEMRTVDQQISKILKNGHKRTCLLIEGGHDVFVENSTAVEKIIKQYIDASRLYL
ncbi:UNKNOWN [Stylonychia lemnae]|uniref:Uncharacterized protein n=1 Tax=Stylonychia lemnae TaxID=5949 RepID=A0A078A4Q2_STYLE|nr:UNKNOWN [Stylonychia lemnae]|eukprot:CDW76483.1 UNKNOWN [Stylonychia lemnae]